MLLHLDNHEAHISLWQRVAALFCSHPIACSLQIRAIITDGWMRSNPDQTRSIFQIARCVNEACQQWHNGTCLLGSGPQEFFISTEIFLLMRSLGPSMVSDRPNPELLSASEDDPPSESTSVQVSSHTKYRYMYSIYSCVTISPVEPKKPKVAYRPSLSTCTKTQPFTSCI